MGSTEAMLICNLWLAHGVRPGGLAQRSRAANRRQRTRVQSESIVYVTESEAVGELDVDQTHDMALRAEHVIRFQSRMFACQQRQQAIGLWQGSNLYSYFTFNHPRN